MNLWYLPRNEVNFLRLLQGDVILPTEKECKKWPSSEDLLRFRDLLKVSHKEQQAANWTPYVVTGCQTHALTWSLCFASYTAGAGKLPRSNSTGMNR